MKLDIEFETRSGIILLVGLLVAYFALNTYIESWMTFLFQAATVVAMGVILLVINERAQGNMIEMPTFDWRAIIKIVITIVVAIIFIVAGVSIILIGLLGLLPYIPVEILFILFIGAIVLGIIGMVLGFKMLFKFLEVKE